jgi:hypothetical protein
VAGSQLVSELLHACLMLLQHEEQPQPRRVRQHVHPPGDTLQEVSAGFNRARPVMSRPSTQSQPTAGKRDAQLLRTRSNMIPGEQRGGGESADLSSAVNLYGHRERYRTGDALKMGQRDRYPDAELLGPFCRLTVQAQGATLAAIEDLHV